MACQSIAGKVMKDLGFGNLGLINIAIVYLSFALTSVLASFINKKLGTRWTLVLSALTYATWIAGFILPSKRSKLSLNEYENNIVYSDGFIKFIIIITAFLLGLGAGPLWVSQSYHVSKCANQSNKGLYNGIFFTIF
jgi:MFS family permease